MRNFFPSQLCPLAPPKRICSLMTSIGSWILLLIRSKFSLWVTWYAYTRFEFSFRTPLFVKFELGFALCSRIYGLELEVNYEYGCNLYKKEACLSECLSVPADTVTTLPTERFRGLWFPTNTLAVGAVQYSSVDHNKLIYNAKPCSYVSQDEILIWLRGALWDHDSIIFRTVRFNSVMSLTFMV